MGVVWLLASSRSSNKLMLLFCNEGMIRWQRCGERGVANNSNIMKRYDLKRNIEKELVFCVLYYYLTLLS